MSSITFRGSLNDDEVRKIKLSTLSGKTGYRIKTFQVISEDPVSVDEEAVVKIYIDKQSSATKTIDFDDQTLIAVAFFENAQNTAYFGGTTIVFDNVSFNQDIYITNQSLGNPMNFYIELEKIKLTDLEATFHTLQSIKTLLEE